jgi:hypothetical protein
MHYGKYFGVAVGSAVNDHSRDLCRIAEKDILHKLQPIFESDLEWKNRNIKRGLRVIDEG